MLPASVALHAIGVAALLPWPGAGGAAPETPPVEVEFIQQPAATQGAPATSPSEAEAGAPPPPPGTEPAPAPPPGRAARARAPSPPAVNLGDAEAARDALEVTGRGVVPATPNSRFRNQPPGYPMAAARVGAEGTVGLLVQVSAQGVATDVSVARSSGNDSLDRAARDAVRRWRFTPARIQGTPVPFEYPLDINFILGDR